MIVFLRRVGLVSSLLPFSPLPTPLPGTSSRWAGGGDGSFSSFVVEDMMLRMGEVVSGVLEGFEICREIPSPFKFNVEEFSLAQGFGETDSLDCDVTSN